MSETWHECWGGRQKCLRHLERGKVFVRHLRTPGGIALGIISELNLPSTSDNVVLDGGLFVRIREQERQRKIAWSVVNGAGQSGIRNVLPAKGISTGSYGFDKAIGVGGVPRGRISEVFGPASCGKTTLALQVVASAQKEGAAAAFIDAEHALDLRYAGKLGVQVEELIMSKPDCGEQALSVALSLVETGLVGLVVVDSVAALVPESELAGEMGEDYFDDIEQMLGKGLRRLELVTFRMGACVLFTNQIRRRSYETTGDPDTTAGGRPLRFYASVRMQLSKLEPVFEHGTAIGGRVEMRVIKNRVASANRSAIAPLIHGEGFSKEMELLEIAASHGVVESSRGDFSYRGNALTRSELRADPRLAEELMEEVRASARLMRSKPVARVLASQETIVQTA